MIITFKSHATCILYLKTENETIPIPPLGSYRLDTEAPSFSFSVYACEKSNIVYAIKKFGVIFKRNFNVCSSYNITAIENDTINLFTHSKKGSFGDRYNRVAVTCTSSKLSEPFYSVTDEEEIKKEFNSAKKKTDRVFLLFDLIDIIKNAFIALLFLIVPFALIWIFGSFESAYTICGYLYIPILAIIIIFNRITDKYKKKIWNFAKGKALKNHIFQGTDSYFSNDYISFVFSK